MENISMTIEQINSLSKMGTGFVTDEGLQKYSDMLKNGNKNKTTLDILDILDYMNSEKLNR
jgi:hypothetical protein